ncbi:site-specific integrase [Sinorhizobium meliloti]|uniref:Tyrosine-type recombinase/integrase n=2 Tax=Rhizobium meliloti TaxID=382 RepID=A0AAW9TUA6_RHIML|nr:site-specific integrase [Sinorhizobium meliloti]MQW35431.1 tyrosine-type recombinase/integrase [Sinorhizobium meliloti]
MLEFYFSYGGVLKRLRSGALGGEMDRLAEHFFRLGYKRASAKIYLSRIARFSRFAGTRCGPMPIHQDVVDSYLRTFPTDTPRIGAMSALGHARRVAPERFIISVPSEEDDPDAPVLASFSDYLRRVRGLEPKSREGVLLGGRRFLDWCRHHHPGQDIEALTAKQVLAAVEYRLSLSTTSGSRTAATSHIRTFLRFLYWAGRHHQDLARIVPRTPSWRLAHLPPRLAWDDVRHAIDAIGATTPVGIRDRAVLLLLATTGIRNGELRAIRLRDIDWRTGEVFVRRTKGKRDRVVPLLEETGAALADYILRARPRVDSPYLFLSFTPPVGPFKCAAPVSRIVRKRLRHGGVELGRVAGAHLLRHSLATQLVGQRRPINEVADLLGHRSINTTALYVKVAASQLAEVALPFPGGVA